MSCLMFLAPSSVSSCSAWLSSSERYEPAPQQGRPGRDEGRGEAGGGAKFFNGIFKDGFKLEVISMFMFERGKSKSCVLARGFVSVRACVCT